MSVFRGCLIICFLLNLILGASSSKFHLTLYFLFLGTSPLTVKPTTGHGKELMGKAQGRKGEQEAKFELISKVNMFGVFSYDVKCKEVCFWD